MNNTSTTSLHGVFMHVFNTGCLITGESQSGKSELALSLIDRGHSLIADDCVDFFINENNSIQGKAPKSLENLLEIRHLGVINVCDHFGNKASKTSAKLDLIINLEDHLNIEVERLTPIMKTHEILGSQITTYALPSHTVQNLALLVETTVREHRLQQCGRNANLDLKLKHNQQVRQKL